MGNDEEWRTVPGHEKYRVSNLGRVMGPICELKQRPNPEGYLTVCISAKPKKKMPSVHSLVLSAFVGPRPAGAHGCHVNGVRTDNRAENLKWATQSENEWDKLTHRTMAACETHGMSKLTSDQVREIRGAYESANGATHWGASEFAKRFGVQRNTISLAARGIRWGHLDVLGERK
jgi:hypothetical protein